jgi:OOP family OmpA-OmpF porin
MIKRLFLLILSGVIAALLAMPASAQWYVGGAAGVTRTKIGDDVLPISGSTASSLTTKDASASVYSLAAGYDFTRNWALEGGYSNNGKFSARRTSTAGTVGTLGAQSEGSAWFFTGIGKLPIYDQFYLFGKLGIAATTTKTNLDTSGAVTLPAGTSTRRRKSESNLLWGLGAGYDFNRTVGLRLDYTRIQNVGDASTGEGDVHTLTAGVKFSF